MGILPATCWSFRPVDACLKPVLGQRLRKEKCRPPPFVNLSAELTSTAGSQGQSEGRGSSLSIHSLPSGPSSPFSTEDQPVASWALSFERLLQDPLGLAYFTVSPGVGGEMVERQEAGFWRRHRPGFRVVRAQLLSMVPHLACLWHPSPHHRAGNSSFLSSSLLLIFFLRSGTICLSVWCLGPVSVPVFEHSRFSPA